MKKALSMILVLTMVLALALPAMADTIETWPAGATSEESTQNVTATYTKESHTAKPGDVLYFTITWTANTTGTALAYTGEQATYTWNGAEMRYYKNDKDSDYVAAGWNDGTAGYTITVSNQSNIALSVVNTASVNFGLDLKQKVKTQGKSDFGTEQPYPVDGTTTTLASAADGVKYESGNGTAQSVSILYTFAKGENSTFPKSTDVLTGGKTVTVGTLKVVVSKATGNA